MSLCRLQRKRGTSPDSDRLLAELYDVFDEGHATDDLRQARSLLGIP